MNILIAGITGLIGEKLSKSLSKKHTVIGLGRQLEKVKKHCDIALTWNDSLEDKIKEHNISAIINLCGEDIGQLWLNQSKHKIRNSRVLPTTKIASILKKFPNIHLINASGIGVYGFIQNANDQYGIEEFPAQTPKGYNDTGFLCTMGREWEDCSKNHPNTTYMRLAPVFDYNGGIYRRLTMSCAVGLMTQFGEGNSPFPWVSLLDVVNIIELIIDKKITGPINVCSPEIMTLHSIIQTIASRKNCYTVTVPSAVVKVLVGQMGNELFLNGTATKPDRLLKKGYNFNHPTFKEFINNTF